MIHGPLDFFGLLPSGLSIVKGIRSRGRWANVHDEIPLTLINDRRHVRAVDGWAPCVRGLPNTFQEIRQAQCSCQALL